MAKTVERRQLYVYADWQDLAQGVKLNIPETDNALDLDLAREVASYFRLTAAQAEVVLAQVVAAVRQCPAVASRYQLSRAEQEMMAGAFAAGQ